MLLVDTSIWMDHLRSEDTLLAHFLANDQVMMHSMIRGELAMGYLRNRDYIAILNGLRTAPPEGEPFSTL